MTILLLLVPFLLLSCIDDAFFGESSYNFLFSFEVEGISSSTKISNDTVSISISEEKDPAVTVVSVMSFSRFAKSSISVGDTLDCVEPYPFTITAENGTIRTYTLVVNRSSGEQQIENGDFEQWYTLRGGFVKKDYFQPGSAADNTIWATANEGVVTVTVDDTNTVPYENPDNTFGVKLKTIDAPEVLGIKVVPIAAGTIFTGTFNKDIAISDPLNPMKAVNFGTPFSSRPKSVSFRYMFKPGLENRDFDGNLLEYKDQFSAYLLLEVRSGDEHARLATAWVQDSTEVTQWKDTTIELHYGELPPEAPQWERPANGLYASPTATPTHLTFVASSSCKGDLFEGAIGSELILDDLILNY